MKFTFTTGEILNYYDIVTVDNIKYKELIAILRHLTDSSMF